MNSFFSKEFEDPKYVAPTSDIGFHWVFGKEGNEELVVQLLNACIDDKEILSVKRLNTEHVVNAETTFRFDLYCECSDGDCGVPELQQEAEFSQEGPCVFGIGDYGPVEAEVGL